MFLKDVSPELLSVMIPINFGCGASVVRGHRNKILVRVSGEGRKMGLRLCRVNWGVVTGSKECPYCLVFVLTFFVKGVDSFDKLVAGCCISDSLEGIGEYWKAWYLVVK